MSEKDGVIAYTVQACVGGQIILCVMDEANQKYHQFPLSLLNASRLAYECAGYINSDLGGYTRVLGKPG